MTNLNANDDKTATAPKDEGPPRRLAWEEPTLQRLSLSQTEANLGTGADGSVESTLS